MLQEQSNQPYSFLKASKTNSGMWDRKAVTAFQSTCLWERSFQPVQTQGKKGYLKMCWKMKPQKPRHRGGCSDINTWCGSEIRINQEAFTAAQAKAQEAFAQRGYGCSQARVQWTKAVQELWRCQGWWHSPALFSLHPPPSRPDLGVWWGGITIQADKWRCGWPWNSPLRHRNCYSPSAAAISFPSPLRVFGILFFLSTTAYIYVTAREGALTSSALQTLSS